MPEYRSPQNEPGMERNLLLIFLLIAVVIFVSQVLMKKFSPQQPASSAKPTQPIQAPPASTQTSPEPTAAAATTAKPAVRKGSAPAPRESKQASSEAEVVVENDFYRIKITNRGAQATSWVLKKFLDDQGKPLDLVNSNVAAKHGYPLSLWTYDENLRNKLNNALYVVSRPDNGDPLGPLEFQYSDGELTVRKTLKFDRSYAVGVETSVFSSDTPVYAFPAWPSGLGDQINLPGYASAQLEYQFNNQTEHVSVKKISGGATMHGSYNWAGVSDSYFGIAFIPDNAENLTLVTLRNGVEIAEPGKPNETKTADAIGIAVGRPGTSSERLFVGPKALEVLESVHIATISGAEKDLRGMVNFGWFSLIARPLFIWLRWTNGFIHNWGWSIVLQTLVITLALLPLRIHQLKSALKMQRVQPQMKAIQEKYKKYSMRDPRKQEMNKEIADLYKREGVNPAGGCLPLLIQLPFLYAYYRMLSVAIDLRQAHWLWIHDLSAADPYLILPILMALSMFVLQKMTPQAGMDPTQQRMMNIMMPAMMGFFFFRLPAGLNLYYAESNLIMMAQTWIMNRTELGREMREMAAKRARKKDKKDKSL
jgi:YidC/Oxa1 family membrane protein insertase